jgi:ArsR family transcriptional regulator
MAYDVMNDTQRKIFQEKLDIDFSFELGEVARFRVNVFMQRGSVSAAFRLIPSEIQSLETLGLPAPVAGSSARAAGATRIWTRSRAIVMVRSRGEEQRTVTPGYPMRDPAGSVFVGDRLYQRLSALSEPARVRLLWVIAQEELSVGELCRVLQQPQSTVSRQLKVLQEGWVRRRAEGTSAWFRLDALDDEAARLWAVVAEHHAGTPAAHEDRARLTTVLDARRLDARSFYGRTRGDWEAIRSELFGSAFVRHVVAGLVPAGWTVADLGCGTGETLALLAPMVDRAIGVDREPEMVAAAAQRVSAWPNAEVLTGALEALPLPDACADAALLSLVLHHVPDPAAALGEVARILRPGGRAVVTDMVAHAREEYRWTMGHEHLGFSAEDLEAAAAAAGLRVSRRVGLPSEPDATGPPLFVALLGR